MNDNGGKGDNFERSKSKGSAKRLWTVVEASVVLSLSAAIFIH